MTSIRGRSKANAERRFLIIIPQELRAPLIAFAGLFIVSALISSNFLTPYNQKILIVQTAPLAMLALGETIVLLMGSIDLSPGSVMGFASLVAAVAYVYWGLGFELSVLMGILAGAMSGFLIGLMVTKGKIPSFVASLAMLVGLRGLILVGTQGVTVSGLTIYSDVFLKEYVSIPIMIYMMILFVVFLYFILKLTSFGLQIYAIGGNEEAVRVSGINVDLIKIIGFTMAGFLYGIAGIMITARLQVAYAWTGWGAELDAIASCVLGGISLAGGVGHPVGPLLGAYMLTLITNIMILLGIDPYYQWVVKAIILVIIAGTTLARQLRYAK